MNTSQWSRTDSPPQASADLRGAVHKNTGYLMGGFAGGKLLNTVYTASIDKLISNAYAVDQPTDDSNSTDNPTEDNLTWKVVTNTTDYIPSAVVTSGMVLAIGGAESSDLSSKSIRCLRTRFLVPYWRSTNSSRGCCIIITVSVNRVHCNRWLG